MSNARGASEEASETASTSAESKAGWLRCLVLDALAIVPAWASHPRPHRHGYTARQADGAPRAEHLRCQPEANLTRGTLAMAAGEGTVTIDLEKELTCSVSVVFLLLCFSAGGGGGEGHALHRRRALLTV